MRNTQRVKVKAVRIQEGESIAQMAGNANLVITQILHSLTTAAYEQGFKAGYAARQSQEQEK